MKQNTGLDSSTAFWTQLVCSSPNKTRAINIFHYPGHKCKSKLADLLWCWAFDEWTFKPVSRFLIHNWSTSLISFSSGIYWAWRSHRCWMRRGLNASIVMVEETNTRQRERSVWNMSKKQWEVSRQLLPELYFRNSVNDLKPETSFNQGIGITKNDLVCDLSTRNTHSPLLLHHLL